MQNLDLKNSCENCKFYRRYYMIKRAALFYVGSGMCFHHYMTLKERKTIPQIYDCPHWSIAEGAEETCDVAHSLKEISMRLKEIKLILGRQDDHQEHI